MIHDGPIGTSAKASAADRKGCGDRAGFCVKRAKRRKAGNREVYFPFSGIGGLDFGLEQSGHQCIAQVEIDPLCRRVLATIAPCAAI